jgi:hypothetical protein
MTCTGSGDDVTFTRSLRISTWWPQANPASGQEDSLQTLAQTNIPLDQGSPAGFIAALGVFAAFGALSIGIWLTTLSLTRVASTSSR